MYFHFQKKETVLHSCRDECEVDSTGPSTPPLRNVIHLKRESLCRRAHKELPKVNIERKREIGNWKYRRVDETRNWKQRTTKIRTLTEEVSQAHVLAR